MIREYITLLRANHIEGIINDFKMDITGKGVYNDFILLETVREFFLLVLPMLQFSFISHKLVSISTNAIA